MKINLLLIAGFLAMPLQALQGLDLSLYAGLTITGSVGRVYSIECVTDLAQTNTENGWRCLEFLQLPSSPHLWVDKSLSATGQRFYRAVVCDPPTDMVFIPAGAFRMGGANCVYCGGPQPT